MFHRKTIPLISAAIVALLGAYFLVSHFREPPSGPAVGSPPSDVNADDPRAEKLESVRRKFKQMVVADRESNELSEAATDYLAGVAAEDPLLAIKLAGGGKPSWGRRDYYVAIFEAWPESLEGEAAAALEKLRARFSQQPPALYGDAEFTDYFREAIDVISQRWPESDPEGLFKWLVEIHEHSPSADSQISRRMATRSLDNVDILAEFEDEEARYHAARVMIRWNPLLGREVFDHVPEAKRPLAVRLTVEELGKENPADALALLRDEFPNIVSRRDPSRLALKTSSRLDASIHAALDAGEIEQAFIETLPVPLLVELGFEVVLNE